MSFFKFTKFIKSAISILRTVADVVSAVVETLEASMEKHQKYAASAA